MKNRVLVLILLSFLCLMPDLAVAEEGMETSTDLEFQVTSLPEARLRLNQSFIFPFLQGQNPLFQDNNIKIVLSADFTPITLAAIAELSWTPAAFFFLSAGGKAGSGWNIPIAKGIGINTPIGAKTPGIRDSEIKGKAFDGLIWGAWGAGTFQFDLGALIPGDWNHIVFQTRQEFRYSGYTRAGPDDSWVLENDDGEDRNGWKYAASYVIGYQMPLSPVLSMIGIIAELDKNLTTFPGGDTWGDALGYWIFSGMGVFTITPRFNATVALQVRTRRNYGISDFNNTNNSYYYQDRELKDGEIQRHLFFYRAALILNYKLR